MTKKRVFEVTDGKPVEVIAKPVEAPVTTTTPAPTATPEKVHPLTAAAKKYRDNVWTKLSETLSDAKLAAVRSATSLAACVARFGQENLPIDLTNDFKSFIASAVENAGKPKAQQFTSEAWGLVRNLDDEMLAHIRGGAFNGKTGVTLDEVLVALYRRNQVSDEKHGELDTDADGKPVVLTCGCGVCNGRKFVRETWNTGRMGNGPRVGNYVPGNLVGSPEQFVPVSRKCMGRINKAVFEANAPIAAQNAEIAARREDGERTEPFQPMKPMIHGVSSRDAEKILKGQKAYEDRRQASDDKLAAIVNGLKPPVRTGAGRPGASAYPQTRRGESRESRF